MSMGTAIEKGYICDYKLFLPSITEVKIDSYDKSCIEIDLNKIANEFAAKCEFLFKCMSDHGKTKCIVYLQSHNDIEKFIETMQEMNKDYAYDLNINSISCNDSKTSRENKIVDFTTFRKGISVLCSVDILNECIDIKECDSVFITYNCKRKIKIVQRLCRAIGKDSNNNKNKVAHMYLWSDGYSESINIISALKEHDVNIKEKIHVVSRNYATVVRNNVIVEDQQKH